jgi:hypothetical protein
MAQTLVLKEDPEVLERLERIERLVVRLAEGRSEKRAEAEDRGDVYYTGPEFLLKHRCGRDKLKQLVAAGAVERDDSFGKNPRYRWIRKEAAK